MAAELNRIGVVLGWDAIPMNGFVAWAQRAEELGYETLWVGETWARDAFAVLAQIALGTSRIKLGTSVISIFSRTPGMLAQSAATLDEISGGRTILGLGPSSRTLVEGWHGVPFDRPIERMRELVPLLRKILSGERVDFEGEFYRMSGLSLGFDPPRHEIPIYLGSLSPLHLELTGELADGWLPTFFAPARLEGFIAHLARGAERAERTLGAVDLAPWMLTCASRDPAQARALAREHVAFFTAAYGDAYQKLVRRYGFEDEVDRLALLWKNDRTRLVSGVSDALLDTVAITGTPEQCRERFAELHARGLDLPAVLIPTRAPLEVVRETLEAIAPRPDA
ncbi:MAG: LLM class flavin-dependent oxidoreductase [Deltaproteobacteria bacterium]|nr:LLM class flavin-dependent oxidoreductase [Deltaproteobacteria bacterium]